MIIDRLGQFRLTLLVNNTRLSERHSVMRKILPLYLSAAMLAVGALLAVVTSSAGLSYGEQNPQVDTPVATATPMGSNGGMGCC